MEIDEAPNVKVRTNLVQARSVSCMRVSFPDFKFLIFTFGMAVL